MFNSKGNALLIVLILVASVMTTSLIVMGNSANLGQIFARKSHSQIADNVSQLIGSIVADPGVCLNGFDGTGSEAGLQFVDSSNNLAAFNLTAASSASGQPVSIPSNFPNLAGGGRQRLQAGLLIPKTSLQIQRLYLADATPDPILADTYQMNLMAQFGVVANTQGLSARQIASLQVQITAGAVSGCQYSPSATSNKTLCEGMNCTYTTSAGGESNCYCPVQAMTCPAGRYVESIVNYVPQCSSATITRSCASTANSYLVALDSNSNPVCAQVVACPAGTTASGLGGTAVPSECKCTTGGYTWNAGTSICEVATALVNGACGTSSGGTFATAPVTNLCSAGTASAVSGSGPWTWDCNGLNGGSNLSCSAAQGAAPICTGGATNAVTAVPASPAGCYCAANEIWNGISCVVSLPTAMCNVYYRYLLNGDFGVTGVLSNGAWAQKKNKDQNYDCINNGCGLKVGVSCTGEAELRLKYQYQELSTPGTEGITPWSGTTGAIQWGDWALLKLATHPSSECGYGRRCGLRVEAETNNGKPCSVSYQYRNEDGQSPVASNGAWSLMGGTTGKDNCDDGWCGIRIQLNCL